MPWSNMDMEKNYEFWKFFQEKISNLYFSSVHFVIIILFNYYQEKKNKFLNLKQILEKLKNMFRFFFI